ncbi:PREDICTED: probable purine permease 14 [Camelina sativa]|uniref:Probable purine permease n=1 Tax=Camelina sativa TaxID=90675 RepID=A0ABM0WPT3_CAMSA|nr:PREDICTED: probable purine permease 14 [Camelina sativa]
MQKNPQETLINMELDPTTLIKQTEKPIKWRTIIICIMFVITGQSIARLLETFYDHHTNRNHFQYDGVWTQPLLRVIGYPLLLPFFILSSRKHNQLLITSDPSSHTVLYLCTGVLMVVQVKLYVKGKLETPFTKSLLIEGTHLYFTSIFSGIVNRIKFNLWIVISLIFTVVVTTLSSNLSGDWSALLASITFSFLLCNIHSIFITNSTREASFKDVLELLIFSSLLATIASVFISGESHDLKRGINGFSKGKVSYVMTMVGQAAAWQIYGVGLVGLVVFADSIVTSNVISLCTYPIVAVLRILFCNYEEEEFSGFLGAALVLSAIAVASSFYKHKRGFGNWKMPRVLRFVVLFVVYYFYISEFLKPDPYISTPMGFELF